MDNSMNYPSIFLREIILFLKVCWPESNSDFQQEVVPPLQMCTIDLLLILFAFLISGQQRLSPDSGVSSLRAPTSASEAPSGTNSDRSGSRSSTLSSSDDSLKAVKASMGDRQPPGSSSSMARPPTAPGSSGKQF